MVIPIIDCHNDVLAYGNEIFTAIETVGFVYLLNCGIDSQLIDQVYANADEFWSLPASIKHKYARPTGVNAVDNSGYVAPGVERLDPTRKGTELKEAFNVTPSDQSPLFQPMPDDEVSQFRSSTMHLFDRCVQLTNQLLYIIAVHLDINSDDLLSWHNRIGIDNNATTLRLLHYPPVPDDADDDCLVRCGEHSDYGTITLLFQDDAGGLEISNRTGQFVSAAPVANACLVNTGDLLQRWTNDRIPAVRHRVLVPVDGAMRSHQRRSIAFFVHPNDDAIVQPLGTSSNVYQPITARQYLLDMFSKTY